jgi:hypothetical protein
MFFSKSLALTPYLFQQILMKHINSYSLKGNKSNKWKLWFFMIIVIYKLNVLFASLNYEPFFFNIEMKKFKKLNNNFELFTLFISLIIAEKFFLNINMYRHHIIG